MKIETLCLHGGYTPGNGEPRVLPICQSTTFTYDSTEDIGALFDLNAAGYFYSRLANPTVNAVEEKINLLEGGVGALCTSSGQAAVTLAILNLCNAGDHVICSSTVYGGTFNLLGVTLKRLGIECTFIDVDSSPEEILAAFKPNTKAVYGETLANPALTVMDIEKFAKVAHANKVPLIVDNTFATPCLCKPFEFGADIVVHSTSKYMDGHALQIGGVIVDSGNFDWVASGKFPGLCLPDDSYHGVVYVDAFGKAAFICKARLQLMRDFGVTPSPNSAFLLNLGLETLPLRMERYCENATKVSEFLAASDKVEFVNYPGLKANKYNALAKKYLPKGVSGVISFSLKGGREAAIKFMDSLTLASNVVHVADIRTCVLHPASSTHRQMNDEQLVAAGITPGMVRFSVGLENIEDILADIAKGFEQI